MTRLDALLAEVDAARDDILAFHQATVRFETVNTGAMPTGNETPCCEYIRGRLAAEGMAGEVLESAPGRGNLIARLAGTGTGPSLLFMSHLDVVPVEDPAAWSHAPFGAEIAGGKVWGRGSGTTCAGGASRAGATPFSHQRAVTCSSTAANRCAASAATESRPALARTRVLPADNRSPWTSPARSHCRTISVKNA